MRIHIHTRTHTAAYGARQLTRSLYAASCLSLQAQVYMQLHVSGWQGNQMLRMHWSTGAGKYLNQLFSFKFGPAISIDWMAFVCFPPIGFAAIIHLHVSKCITYNAWESGWSSVNWKEACIWVAIAMQLG